MLFHNHLEALGDEIARNLPPVYSKFKLPGIFWFRIHLFNERFRPGFIIADSHYDFSFSYSRNQYEKSIGVKFRNKFYGILT